jgi:SAM-dependent methyltransferase
MTGNRRRTRPREYGKRMHTTKNSVGITGKTDGADTRTINNEFDRYADSYNDVLNRSLRFSGYDSSFFDERKIREIYEFLKQRGLAEKPLRFLNFGCGIGKSEKFITRYFPQAAVYSADTSRESIELAKANNRGRNNITFSVFDGYRIPFETEFDVVLAANVFHHIPRAEHVAVVKHISDNMTGNGHLFLFEHNPFNLLTRRVVHSSAFDKNAVLLSPLYAGRILRAGGFPRREIRFIHFVPKFMAFLTPMERLLRKVPFGAQYYFIATKETSRC